MIKLSGSIHPGSFIFYIFMINSPYHMLKKITFLYQQHFKFIVLLNLFVSICFVIIFWNKGYNHYPLYMLALMLKLVSYGISTAIEKLFFQSRSFHFRNLGFSYRMLFGWLYAIDFLFFIMILLISLACKTFM